MRGYKFELFPEDGAEDLYPSGAYSALQVRADTGVDIPAPKDVTIAPGETVRLDLGLRAVCTNASSFAVSEGFGGRIAELGGFSLPKCHGYWLVPRSSISKTPLMLVNSIGLIDAGYRGPLCATVWNRGAEAFEVKRGTSLFQLAAPDLSPPAAAVHSAEALESMYGSTARGSGGFGSTGATGSAATGL